MNADIISYYKERANEYETIYHKPERQHDLMIAKKILQEIFIDKDVFEIGCGTGYWTEAIAKTASSVLATDVNENVIEVAKAKQYSPAQVSFQTADIFNLTNNDKHQSLFGGFIWSHIKLQDLGTFTDIVNDRVESGGTIVFIDNKYVEGSSTAISEIDEWGNTYQERNLTNGSIYKVIKNFPDEVSIREVLKNKTDDIRFVSLQYFWIVAYQSK